MHPKHSAVTLFVGIVLGLALTVVLVRACARPEEQPAEVERPETEVDRAERLSKIEREMTPLDAVEAREGIAVLVLVDVSRSMWTAIIDSRSPLTVSSQIVIGQRAVVNLVRQFDRHARAHPDEPVLVGLFAFGAEYGPTAREVIPLSPPDPVRTEQAFPSLANEDGESIGNAMIAGKRALDQTGLTRRHLFVVTDGGNAYGYDPVDVMAALTRRPEAERPSVYFVAFNLEAPRFEALRKEGGQVLDATNAGELKARLEQLLTGKVLVERP